MGLTPAWSDHHHHLSKSSIKIIIIIYLTAKYSLINSVNISTNIPWDLATNSHPPVICTCMPPVRGRQAPRLVYGLQPKILLFLCRTLLLHLHMWAQLMIHLIKANRPCSLFSTWDGWVGNGFTGFLSLMAHKVFPIFSLHTQTNSWNRIPQRNYAIPGLNGFSFASVLSLQRQDNEQTIKIIDLDGPHHGQPLKQKISQVREYYP